MAKAHTVTDNFNDNSVNTARWTPFANPAPVAERIREVNGRIEVRPASGGTGYSGLTSTGYDDITGSEVQVRVVRALTPPLNTVETFLRVRKDASNRVALIICEGLISCELVLAGQYTYFSEYPYDELLHRWLRIRERDGSTFWEYSPDGCDWTVLATRANPFAMNVVDFEIGAGTWGAVASPGVAIFDSFNTPATSLSRRVEERRLSARDVRVKAADLAAARPHPEHVNNNDEANTPAGVRDFVGSYSKSLKHDSLGDPDAFSYDSLLRALQSQDPGDFEEIVLGSAGAVRLTNPQGGLAFDVAGPDAQEMTQPPAPRFDSEETAHEAGELYWMAVARDVYFGSYPTDAVIAAAIASINSEFPRYGGPRPATAQNVFRGIFQGEEVGPYVSQFLWKGNTDQRKPDGLGRDANEGFVSYGAQVIDQRIVPQAAGVDYLTDFTTWLNVQNGTDPRGQDQFDTVRRFIRNLRDGATYVHFDQVINAFYNAAWILMSEPTGNQLAFLSGTTGRPQVDLEFAKDQGNPYDPPGTSMDSRIQVGFGTFGPIHLLQVLGEVLGRAIRAVWWQKWGVHRRLRPEEYGGRVRNQATGARFYPIDSSIVNSLKTGGLAPYFGNAGERFPNSFLLPQAYAEGAPTHPAYGAGHATGGAACATMLKAFFDESMPIENPVIASADGLSLLAYTEADAGMMTVGGELNKLAGNISLFRNAAGVHWRSDHTQSLLFGEAIAIAMLQEMSLTFNEDDAFFQLTRFDGHTIRIRDGKVLLPGAY